MSQGLLGLELELDFQMPKRYPYPCLFDYVREYESCHVMLYPTRCRLIPWYIPRLEVGRVGPCQDTVLIDNIIL